MPDELDRWAAGRAPELLARAEAEAVEELKRALLKAALERQAARAAQGDARESASPGPRPAAPGRPDRRRAAPEPEPAPSGEGLWAYCITRASEPPAVDGVHGSQVERIEEEGLAVLVSRVPLGEFGEDALRRNLNDLDWLERVARDHEAVLEHALEGGTIVPLRICTIFADERGAARMLADQRQSLDAALDVLEGRQEWGVKLIVDRAALEAAAREHAPEAFDAELEGQSAGGAYMLRRRQERQLREAADGLAGEIAEDVHARLQDWATDAVLNPPQNPELSGHEGDMLLNAAYLVEAEKVERLHELVAELRERHRGLGARLDADRAVAAVPLRSPDRVRAGMSRSVVIAERDVALVDLVDRLLGGGVVIAGDITLSVADVDLVYVGLRALVSSVATAEEKGILPHMGDALGKDALDSDALDTDALDSDAFGTDAFGDDSLGKSAL